MISFFQNKARPEPLADIVEHLQIGTRHVSLSLNINHYFMKFQSLRLHLPRSGITAYVAHVQRMLDVRVSLFSAPLLQRRNFRCHSFHQERIRGDGGLSRKNESYVIGSPVGGSLQTVPPDIAPVRREQLERIIDFIESSSRGQGQSVVVISGAGCSTESNIPDYRSPNGAYSTGFKPMTHQQFMMSDENRSRYWARSFAGWEKFSSVVPNSAHVALAELEKKNYVHTIITQNVDRLHQKAGSRNVLELHGTTHNVVCMSCRQIFPRQEVQDMLHALNPTSCSRLQRQEDEKTRLYRAGSNDPLDSKVVRQNPDGDVEIQQVEDFKVPSCPSCSKGILKPDVVFFGDSLPPERTKQSIDLASNASGILVVGSSLAVMSAYRLVQRAKDNGSKICIITAGETRADHLADLKFDLLVGESLPMVSARLAIPNVHQ